MDGQADQSITNIFILTDWEKDIWKRVYFQINMKKAVFSYTLHKKEAQRNIYTKSLANIHDCKIKLPKHAQKSSPDTSLKTLKVTPQTRSADTDDDSRSPISQALDALVFDRPPGYGSSCDNDKSEQDPYLMRLVDDKGKELA